MYSGGLYGIANALPGWSPLHLYRHGEFARGYPAFAPLAGVEYAVRYDRGGDIDVQRLPTWPCPARTRWANSTSPLVLGPG